jgi:hypothetical protein
MTPQHSLWAHALVLGAIVVLAGIGHRAPRLFGTLLALLSLVWLRKDGTMEGGTLWTAMPGHGLTVADFVGLGGLVVAAYLWVIGLWNRRR